MKGETGPHEQRCKQIQPPKTTIQAIKKHENIPSLGKDMTVLADTAGGSSSRAKILRSPHCPAPGQV